jgi:hypothetical protein
VNPPIELPLASAIPSRCVARSGPLHAALGTIAACLILIALVSPTLAFAQAILRVDSLVLGPLSLRPIGAQLLELKLTDESKIVDGTSYRKFRVSSDFGIFEYKNADGTSKILSGHYSALKITGYLHRSGPDSYDSLRVEDPDNLTFILNPEAYSLPAYGGGTISLHQRKVWVGNRTSIDLLNSKGTIYFRTDGVTWDGIQFRTDSPAATFAVNARNSMPEQGVTFEFDLGTGQLSLSDGIFDSTSISEATSEGDAGTGQTILRAVDGALTVTVRKGAVSASSSKIALAIDAAALTDGPTIDGAIHLQSRVSRSEQGQRLPTAAHFQRISLPSRIDEESLVALDDSAPAATKPVGLLSRVIASSGTLVLRGMKAVAEMSTNLLTAHDMTASSAAYTPATNVTSGETLWKDQRASGLLQELQVASPDAIRQLAINEAQQQIAGFDKNQLLVVIKRSLIEKVLKTELAKLPHVKLSNVDFGVQSIRLAGSIFADFPLAGQLSLPVDLEISPSVHDQTLVLRPIVRFLMLGQFVIPKSFNVADAIKAFQLKLTSIVKGNEAGFVEIALPVDLAPRLDIDLSTISAPGLSIENGKYTVPLDLRPAFLVNQDSLWILVNVKFPGS